MLERLTLAAINKAVRFAREFEDEFVKIVVSEQYRRIQAAQKQNQRKLDAAKKREQELDIMFSKIYEDHALDKLPDSQYQKLLHKYQEEYDILREQIRHLDAVVKEELSHEMDVNDFLKVVQRYTRVGELAPRTRRIPSSSYKNCPRPASVKVMLVSPCLPASNTVPRVTL